MLGKTFSVMCILSFICAAAGGRLDELSKAVFSGAASAVNLTVGLLGMMSLWCGVMNLLKEAGAIEKLSRILAPLLKFLFPTAYKTGNGIDECSANIAANLLGIGNAATPLAIAALEKMQQDNPNKDVAGDDMITLAVMNASSINLMPVTLITMRTLAGSEDPASVVVPIWLCSLFGFVLSVCTAKSMAFLAKRKKRQCKKRQKGANNA